jgi:outer membrane lipoprotein-sorting protein
MCEYDSEKNTFTTVPFTKESLLSRIGLPPDSSVTSLFMTSSMISVLKDDPKGIQASDVKVEEALLEGVAVYKVTFTKAGVLGGALYFDRETDILFKMELTSPGDTEGGESMELNPKLDDSLFSVEPPKGAKGINVSKSNSSISVLSND